MDSPFRTESYTKMSITHFSHTWNVENFTYYTVETNMTPFNTSQHMYTNEFNFQTPFSQFCSTKFYSADARFKFYLSLYPKGDSEEMKDYIAVYLFLDSCSSSTRREVDVVYEISILDSKKKKFGTRTARSKFLSGSCWGFRNMMMRNYLMENATRFLPNDQLSIQCDIKIVTDVKLEARSTNDSEQLRRIAERRAISDYGEMYTQKKFTDIVLVVGGREFSAHKAILAARSPVFAAMFEHECEEKAKNRVNISDVEPETFEAMLKFLYSGDVSLLKEFGAELLLVADKYDLASLKSVCVDSLSVNMDTNTAADILLYADMCNVAYLRDRAIDYIVANTTAVMNTEGWTRISQKNASLVNEVLRELALKGQQTVSTNLQIQATMEQSGTSQCNDSRQMNSNGYKRPSDALMMGLGLDQQQPRTRTSKTKK